MGHRSAQEVKQYTREEVRDQVRQSKIEDQEGQRRLQAHIARERREGREQQQHARERREQREQQQHALDRPDLFASDDDEDSILWNALRRVTRSTSRARSVPRTPQLGAAEIVPSSRRASSTSRRASGSNRRRSSAASRHTSSATRNSSRATRRSN